MRRPGARAAVLAGILLPVLTLTSCTSVRNALGPPESKCFRVLPTAAAAVQGKGAYQGVRYMPPDSLLTSIDRQHPGPLATPVPQALAGAVHTATCLVEYKGSYELSSLTDGWSPSGATTAAYAVVVVEQSSDQILATVLLRKEPLRFARHYPT
jgi:hypothetical protein